jgi:diaminohydroxyphosphoribosylaminopyrimidine deaminase / 5-amino-6-(5-phosphoribosylamino)uracil reductase
MAARRDLAELDRRFMGEAIRLAASALGRTSPNPAVGCLVVRGGRTVARARTAPGGRPHAESEALRQAGPRARGATVYVSLEPCAHYGVTPPCAEALVRAGIRRAVIGCIDPFARVRGRGVAILRRAGIEVAVGVLEAECRRVNEGFFKRVASGRPFVILKLAATLDGRIAAESGDSRWISSAASRATVHRWRNECDALLVGAGTIVADNPRLTCRAKDGRDPVRVVIDARLRTRATARVFTQRSTAPTILVTTRANLLRARRRYRLPNVEVIAGHTRPASDGLVLTDLMNEFGQRGWSKVMIEGGAHLAGAALREGVVDRVAFFVAPRILGCGLPSVEGLHFDRVKRAIRLAQVTVRQVGDDWLIEGRPLAG